MKSVLVKIVRKNPRIKSIIKKIILKSGDFLPSKKIYSPYPVIEVLKSEHESFFGYHDTSPESYDGKLVLLHLYDKAINTQIKVVVVEKESGNIIFNEPSKAFNFQLGSRAMWISNDEFIYNDLNEENILCTRHHNLITNETKTYILPFYNVTHSRKLLSINFERLQATGSEYGYRGHCPEGIWIKSLDLTNFELNTLITKDELSQFPEVEITQRSVINHILPHPEKDQFIFILRTHTKSNIRKDWLFFYDINQKMLRKIQTGSLVSHYTWISDKNILAYTSDLSEKEGFYEIDLTSELITPVLALTTLPGDGHPQYYKGKVVIDSYPNFRGISQVWVLDFKNSGQLQKIASFRHKSIYSEEKRCDLHPRWSREGDCVYIDSAAKGKRTLLAIFPLL